MCSRLCHDRIAPARHCLWPHSNKTFVPAPELHIFVYVGRGLFLICAPGQGIFYKHKSISNPASRSAPMPAAFSMVSALGLKLDDVAVARRTAAPQNGSTNLNLSRKPNRQAGFPVCRVCHHAGKLCASYLPEVPQVHAILATQRHRRPEISVPRLRGRRPPKVQRAQVDFG